MTKVIYTKRHLLEYLLYGSIAGLLFAATVWYILVNKNYADSWIIHAGSVAFFFVIMLYVMRLTRRRQDFNSTWTMLLAGMGAVLIGVFLATLASAILCFIYIPGAQFVHAPRGDNVHNSGVILHIFYTATLENFSAGGFAAVLVAYVIKPDQTDDETADF